MQLWHVLLEGEEWHGDEQVAAQLAAQLASFDGVVSYRDTVLAIQLTIRAEDVGHAAFQVFELLYSLGLSWLPSLLHVEAVHDGPGAA